MSFYESPIGTLVSKCTTWNPKNNKEGFFYYIDLSSVDKDSKSIAKVARYPCSNAPSRARQLVKNGDVLVATVRPNLNGVALVGGEHDGMTASTGYCVLRPILDKLESKFLFHWVKTGLFIQRMIDVAIGANYPAVSDAKVKASTIPLPPLAEQKRIAAILDAADSLRAKRRESLAQLDVLLQSTFIDMFGDPVTNPKGWKKQPLKYCVSSFDGGINHAPTDRERPDGIRVLKVSAVTTGEYRPEESKSFAENEEVANHLLVKKGDLLISRANTSALVGAVCYVWDTYGKEMLPDKIWRFVWKEPKRIEPLFMLQTARSDYFREQLIQRATGTSGSMKNIGKSKMLDIPIPLPPLDLQRRFATIVEAVEQQKTRMRAHLAELEALFASLQHRAFNGTL